MSSEYEYARFEILKYFHPVQWHAEKSWSCEALTVDSFRISGLPNWNFPLNFLRMQICQKQAKRQKNIIVYHLQTFKFCKWRHPVTPIAYSHVRTSTFFVTNTSELPRQRRKTTEYLVMIRYKRPILLWPSTQRMKHTWATVSKAKRFVSDCFGFCR